MPKPYYETELGKLYHGDCLEIMPMLEPVDLVVTSPPYDNLRDYGGYVFDYKRVAENLYLQLASGGVVVWVVGDATVNGSETGTSFKQALYFKDIGFNIHDTMIYAKNQLAFPSKNRYHQAFEYMFIFSKGVLRTFNPIIDRKNISHGRKGKVNSRLKNGKIKKGTVNVEIREYSERFNYWIIYNLKRGIENQHPAVFPESLAHDHILSWSNEGDTVADIMCGSGTTAIACERLNRRWIGIEIEEKYCEIAAKRIEKENQQLKLFV